MERYWPPSLAVRDTVSSAPGGQASQVRLQSQGRAPSGGTAPAYRGREGSLLPAPPVASGEFWAGRRKSGESGSLDFTGMEARTISLSDAGIQPFLHSL